MYRSLGKALLLAVLDTFDKNPHSRVLTSQFYSMENLRRLTAFEVFHEEDRFRMFEQHTYRKVKGISQLIDQQFIAKFSVHKSHNPRCWGIDTVEWPANVEPLARHNRRREESSKELPLEGDAPSNLQSREISPSKRQRRQDEERAQIHPGSVKGIKMLRNEVTRTQEKRNNSVYELQMAQNITGNINVSSIPSYLMNPTLTTMKKELNQQIHTTLKSEIRKEMEQMRVEIKGVIKEQIDKSLKERSKKSVN